jgi:hypothetical protein
VSAARYVTVRLTVDADAAEEAVSHAEKSAWDAAEFLAEASGYSIGSDEHLELHESLLGGYVRCGAHSAYLKMAALNSLHVLLTTRKLAVVSQPNATEESCADALDELSNYLYSSIVYLVASANSRWIDNYDWQTLTLDERSTDFTLAVGGGPDV